MFLKDGILFLLFFENHLVSLFFLLFRPESSCFSLILSHFIDLVFHLHRALLTYCILGVLLFLHLYVLPFLSFLSLFYPLLNSLLTLYSLSTNIVLLFSLHLTELSHFLLLSHHFVDLISFPLFLLACAILSDLFDVFNSLVEVLSFAFAVLILPVFGSLLANLQLDLQII